LKIFLKDGKLNNNYIDNQITKASTDSKYYATKYSRLLCDELMRRGIEPIMEYNDGHKTIDIAILPARLYIEIDGIQHLNNPNQIIKDLKRDYHSYEEGFYTIRIPNQVLENHLGGIADAIAEVVKNSRNL
jgi:very-short-patch-repair endonuclease